MSNSVDSRVDWVHQKIRLIFKVNGEDRLEELLGDSNTLAVIHQFLQNETQLSIYCFVDCNGKLRVSESCMDINIGFQLLYISKTKLTAVPPENFDNLLIWGNICGDIISHMSCVTEDVFLPLFHCPPATMKWPDSVIRALREALNTFLCNVHVYSGYVDGHVHLPIPAEPANITQDGNVSPLHIMESVVITWTKQIRAVLAKNPDDSILAGIDPELQDEIQFWSLKADHLNEIFSQLQGASLRRVLRSLDRSKSTYNSPFAKLCKEVFQARSEANDNCKFLRTTTKWIAALRDEEDYLSLPKRVTPIIHIMLSIWKRSTYYNTLSRLVVFFIKLSNVVVRRSLQSFSSSRVIQCLTDWNYTEALEKISNVIDVIGKFKSVFLSYKNRSNVECPSNPWKVHSSAVFSRMDKYVERCQDLLEIFQTTSAYCKIKHIEIGGSNHRILSTSMSQILEEFELSLRPFHFLGGSVFDLVTKSFSESFFEWRAIVKDLDLRLASIMSQVISKSTNFADHIRILEGFESLLVRNAIFDAARSHHVTLIQSLEKDYKILELEFDTLQSNPPVSRNCSPTAGAIIWSRGVSNRVKVPMSRLKIVDSRLTEREDFRELSKHYTRLVLKLEEYETMHLGGWFLTVEEAVQDKLKLSLLSRKTDSQSGLSHVYVNFDETIIRMMKEIRNFVRLGIHIDETVWNTFSKISVFEGYNSSLCYLVSMYNIAVSSLLPIERPLLRQKLEPADRILFQGHPPVAEASETKSSKQKWLTWKSSSIEQFIEESLVDVRELSDAASTVKSNLRQTIFIAKSWKNLAMFEKTPKILGIGEFDIVQTRIRGQCHQTIKEGGGEILRLLKETNRRLRLSQGLPEWKAYMDFVSDIVVDGLVQCVLFNMRALESSINPVTVTRSCQQPIAEIDIDLIDNMVRYIPDTEVSLEPSMPSTGSTSRVDVAVESSSKTKSTIKCYVSEWLDGMILVGSSFKRIDGSDGDYNRELLENPEIQILQAKINDHLQSLRNRSQNLASVFRKYESLWKVDIRQYCDNFTRDSVDSSKLNKLLDPAPRLSEYDEILNKFMNEQREISEIKNIHDLVCLRVNGLPVKQSLGTLITKWIFQFTSYLQSYVQSRLQLSHIFFSDMTSRLNKKLDSIDHEGLIDLMRCIKSVRDAADDYSNFFADISAVVTLFGRRAISIELPVIGDRQALDFVNCGNVLWTTIVNKAFKMKEDSRALQVSACEKIRLQVQAFSRQLQEFLDAIQRTGIMDYELHRSVDAYNQIDIAYTRLCNELVTSKKLNDLEDLFGMAATPFSAIVVSIKKLHAARKMWNIVDLYTSLVSQWKTSRWLSINLEEVGFQFAEISELLKQLPQLSLSWIVVKQVQLSCADSMMMVSMFGKLRLPEIKDRHWKRFVLASGNDKERGSSLTFGEIMKPNLTNFKKFVDDLAADALKEREIEKRLDNIDSSWSNVIFSFKNHEESDCKVFDLESNVMEVLESDQLAIQSMLVDVVHVEYFKDAVLEWQSKLATVQIVLQLMFEVRHLWFSMEGIFMGSRDVKAQLPDDSKRFENADGRFKECNTNMMDDGSVIGYCVGATVQSDWANLLSDFEQCRKSLADYLNVKRKAFPRFYFLSNSELLELLSMASPTVISKSLLGSIFNGVTGLSFQSSHEVAAVESKTKKGQNHVICGLRSNDETLVFSQPFQCQGSVEKWIGDSVDWMQHSIRSLLMESFAQTQTWDTERPRDIWMSFFPSQICLVSSRLAWTREIETAFEEIDSGSDDAMLKLSDLWCERLSCLCAAALGGLSVSERIKISAMITQDVDFREHFNRFKKSRMTAASFMWRTCFRYYNDVDSGEVLCRLSEIRQAYCNEYLGSDFKITITSLCESAILAVMCAHKSYHSMVMSGSSGFGKTELLKNVSSLYGLPFFCFSCNSESRIQFFENIFKGICATGVWACIESIDSLSEGHLSSIGYYLQTIHRCLTYLSVPSNREVIYQSLPSGTPFSVIGSVELSGEVPIIPTLSLGLCLGKKSFADCPENLKLSLRQCHVTEPSPTIILECALLGYGFSNCREHAVKIGNLFGRLQLSVDISRVVEFALRSMIKVVDMAAAIRVNGSTMSDLEIIVSCIRTMVLPRLHVDEEQIFQRILSATFQSNNATKPAVDIDFAMSFQSSQPSLTNKQVICVKKLMDAMEYNSGVALVGAALSGKTQLWKQLSAYYLSNKFSVETVSFDPQTFSQEEAFGSMTDGRVWKDGYASSVVRRLCSTDSRASISRKLKRWLVIDSEMGSWCDYFNSCMQKDPSLVLESCEKINIPSSTKLLFETTSLESTSPSFVSRVAMIYIHDADFDWKNVVQHWTSRKQGNLANELMDLFERHFIRVLNSVSELQGVMNPTEVHYRISICCNIFDAMALTDAGGSYSTEKLFIFSLMWAIGGDFLASDKSAEFSKIWRGLFGSLCRYPEKENVFDCYPDPVSGSQLNWNDFPREGIMESKGSDSGNLTILSSSEVRAYYLSTILISSGKSVVLNGPMGCGKSFVTNVLHDSCEARHWSGSKCNISKFATSNSLQRNIDSSIEKRGAKCYGPINSSKLIVFVEDLNVAVGHSRFNCPLALIRQVCEHSCLLDRNEAGSDKVLQGVQFVTTANPFRSAKKPSMRCMRHIVSLWLSPSSDVDINQIFAPVLHNQFQLFPADFQSYSKKYLAASTSLLRDMASKFPPSQGKEYFFDFRHIKRLIDGLQCVDYDNMNSESVVQQFWIHEASRQFEDMMSNDVDCSRCFSLIVDTAKKCFDGVETEDMEANPPLFLMSSVPSNARKMLSKSASKALSSVEPLFANHPCALDVCAAQLKFLNLLSSYNSKFPSIRLHFHEYFVRKLAAIIRVINIKACNAVIIGEQCCGKRSLSKLASFYCNYKILTLPNEVELVTTELRRAIVGYFTASKVPVTILLSESHFENEACAMLLSSYIVSPTLKDVMSESEIDELMNILRASSKDLGISGTNASLAKYALQQIRDHFHFIVTIRNDCSKPKTLVESFPALFSNFHVIQFERPSKAMQTTIANFILQGSELRSPEQLDSLSYHFVEIHNDLVDDAAVISTAIVPGFRSFCENLDSYCAILKQNHAQIVEKIGKYSKAQEALSKIGNAVSSLNDELKSISIDVTAKRGSSDGILLEMGKLRGEIELQRRLTEQERTKNAALEIDIRKIEDRMETDMSIIKPAQESIQNMLSTISQATLAEIRAITKPPPAGIDKVGSCMLIMLCGEKRDFTWDNVKRMLYQPGPFLARMMSFDARNLSDDDLSRLDPLLQDPEFYPEKLSAKSIAASHLSIWITNTYQYASTYKRVKPLMEQLEPMQSTKKKLDASLQQAEEKLRHLEAKLIEVERAFMKSVEEKSAAESSYQSTERKISLSQRMLDGFSDYSKSWELDLHRHNMLLASCAGDCAISSSFMTYAGALPASIRNEKMENLWIPDLKSRDIVVNDRINSLNILSAHQLEEFQTTDIGREKFYLENLMILSSTRKWPLIIDPDGIFARYAQRTEDRKKERSKTDLQETIFVSVSNDKWLKKLTDTLQSPSLAVLEVENCGVLNVIEALLKKSYVSDGKTNSVTINGQTIDVNPKFRLIVRQKSVIVSFDFQQCMNCCVIDFSMTHDRATFIIDESIVSGCDQQLYRDHVQLKAMLYERKYALRGFENDLLDKVSQLQDIGVNEAAVAEEIEILKQKSFEVHEAMKSMARIEEDNASSKQVFDSTVQEFSCFFFNLLELQRCSLIARRSIVDFVTTISGVIRGLPSTEDASKQVKQATTALRFSLFQWVGMSLESKHMLLFLFMHVVSLLRLAIVPPSDFGFSEEALTLLVTLNRSRPAASPVNWISDERWGMIMRLAQSEPFSALPKDLKENSARFNEWFELPNAESEKLPLEWRDLEKKPLLKILVVRALRPDRFLASVQRLVKDIMPQSIDILDQEKLGSNKSRLGLAFSDLQSHVPILCLETKNTPIMIELQSHAALSGRIYDRDFFVMAAGSLPTHMIMDKIELCRQQGFWVVLENIHLIGDDHVHLMSVIDNLYQKGSNSAFRLIMTCKEEYKNLVAQVCFKSAVIKSEPPSTIRNDIVSAIQSFCVGQAVRVDARTKGVIFGICYMHSIIARRQQLCCYKYSNNCAILSNCLQDSVELAKELMEGQTNVNWEEVRYLLKNIVYCCRATEQQDSSIMSSYLDFYMKDSILNEMPLFPYHEISAVVSASGSTPFSDLMDHANEIETGDNASDREVSEVIGLTAPSINIADEAVLDLLRKRCPEDSMVAFGIPMSVDAKIRTQNSQDFISNMTLLSIAKQGSLPLLAKDMNLESTIRETLEALGETRYDVDAVSSNIDDIGAYQSFLLKELRAMNNLLDTIRTDLRNCLRFMRGEIVTSKSIIDIIEHIKRDQFPQMWKVMSYPSLRPFSAWMLDLMQRIGQYSDLASRPKSFPSCMWIGGIFHPRGFLECTEQHFSDVNGLQLTQVCYSLEPTRKDVTEIRSDAVVEGVYLSGLSIEGARWNSTASILEPHKAVEEVSQHFPVVFCKISSNVVNDESMYDCPVYRTTARGDGSEFSVRLKSKHTVAKWVIAGVHLLMDSFEA